MALRNNDIVGRTGYATSVVALVAVPLVMLGIVTGVISSILVAVAAVSLVLIFFSVLVDRRVHTAAAQMNRDLAGRVWIGAFDPHWGLLGEKFGGVFLGLIRVALFAAFWIAFLFGGASSTAVLLAAGGFGISILLTIRQLSDATTHEQ